MRWVAVARDFAALGQHVHQETPDELMRVQPHRLPTSRPVDAIVLPAEGNGAVVGCNEAAVRDGDPVVFNSPMWTYSLPEQRTDQKCARPPLDQAKIDDDAVGDDGTGDGGAGMGLYLCSNGITSR
jgi:hypothetical protein